MHQQKKLLTPEVGHRRLFHPDFRYLYCELQHTMDFSLDQPVHEKSLARRVAMDESNSNRARRRPRCQKPSEEYARSNTHTFDAKTRRKKCHVGTMPSRLPSGHL